jgi:hypothetical protein
MCNSSTYWIPALFNVGIGDSEEGRIVLLETSKAKFNRRDQQNLSWFGMDF